MQVLLSALTVPGAHPTKRRVEPMLAAAESLGLLGDQLRGARSRTTGEPTGTHLRFAPATHGNEVLAGRVEAAPRARR